MKAKKKKKPHKNLEVTWSRELSTDEVETLNKILMTLAAGGDTIFRWYLMLRQAPFIRESDAHHFLEDGQDLIYWAAKRVIEAAGVGTGARKKLSSAILSQIQAHQKLAASIFNIRPGGEEYPF